MDLESFNEPWAFVDTKIFLPWHISSFTSKGCHYEHSFITNLLILFKHGIIDQQP
jgi:hypothetical protein